MENRAVRLGMTLWLAGCFCRAVCQSTAAPPPPEHASLSDYDSFFQRVVQRRDLPKVAPVLLNGQPANLTEPGVQDAAGLTDPEMQLLHEIAADCEAKAQSLMRIEGTLRWEALMESLESGSDASGPAQRQLKDLEDQRDQVVRDHVLQIKADFGDARFAKIDAFVGRAPAFRPKAVARDTPAAPAAP